MLSVITDLVVWGVSLCLNCPRSSTVYGNPYIFFHSGVMDDMEALPCDKFTSSHHVVNICIHPKSRFWKQVSAIALELYYHALAIIQRTHLGVLKSIHMPNGTFNFPPLFEQQYPVPQSTFLFEIPPSFKSDFSLLSG